MSGLNRDPDVIDPVFFLEGSIQIRIESTHIRNPGCCCLLCDHCSSCTWDVEEILTYGNRLRSTHCRQFLLLEPYLVEPEGLEALGQVGVHGARVQDGTANQERPSVVCGITF